MQLYLNVMLSPRSLIFASSWGFLCLLYFSISILVSGVCRSVVHFNFHELFPLLPMASQAWNPSSFWLSELHRRWPRDQNIRQSIDRLACCILSLLCSLWFIKGSWFPPNHAVPHWKGGSARESENATAMPTVLNVVFSWLCVHLAAVDLWLISKAPIQLF